MGIIYSQNGWILFKGLNCPSSISFVEVTEREIVRVIRGVEICIWCPRKQMENA